MMVFTRLQKESEREMRNVWNRDPYRWYKYKKDWKAIIGQFRLDLRCCRQRITKGYCEKDLWSIRDWFLDVVPDMLEEYKKSHHGSTGILGENYQMRKGSWSMIPATASGIESWMK